MSFVKLSPSFKLVKVATRKKRGDVLDLAFNTMYSPSHVSNVLAGRRNNTGIVNAAYRKVYRREALTA